MRLRLLLRAPHPRRALQGGPVVASWQGRLLEEAVVGHSLLLGGVPRFDILGAPLTHGRGLNSSTPVTLPGVWCTMKRASNL